MAVSLEMAWLIALLAGMGSFFFVYYVVGYYIDQWMLKNGIVPETKIPRGRKKWK
jgi:hypothetical protein